MLPMSCFLPNKFVMYVADKHWINYNELVATEHYVIFVQIGSKYADEWFK